MQRVPNSNRCSSLSILFLVGKNISIFENITRCRYTKCNFNINLNLLKPVSITEIKAGGIGNTVFENRNLHRLEILFSILLK